MVCGCWSASDRRLWACACEGLPEVVVTMDEATDFVAWLATIVVSGAIVLVAYTKGGIAYS